MMIRMMVVMVVMAMVVVCSDDGGGGGHVDKVERMIAWNIIITNFHPTFASLFSFEVCTSKSGKFTTQPTKHDDRPSLEDQMLLWWLIITVFAGLHHKLQHPLKEKVTNSGEHHTQNQAEDLTSLVKEDKLMSRWLENMLWVKQLKNIQLSSIVDDSFVLVSGTSWRLDQRAPITSWPSIHHSGVSW